MFYKLSLYAALAIFGLGLVYKISAWFRYRIGVDARGTSPAARVGAAVKGILLTLFSGKIITLLKVFVLDVILQVKVFREDFPRWLMHMFIIGGFMMLLLFHALEKYVSYVLFAGYYPTVNPFIFLRDVFGALVVIGVGIAIYRRVTLKGRRLRTNAQDQYAIAILAVIMISGILLHGSKILSFTRYEEMVQEYTIQADEQDLKGLEAYWVKEYGLLSPGSREPFDAETLERGKLVNEMSCLQCHSRPQAAFLSYSVASLMRPVGVALDRAQLPNILWYIHFLACFVGLAYLPFSRMFHIIASPISLLTNAVMERGKSDPANIATRQVMELDACTHCGTCSMRCSVGIVFEQIHNVNILPSEKIGSLKALAAGKELSRQELSTILEGMYLCTNCYRCTVACPAGINLQDLWFGVREVLLEKGYPEFLVLSPLSYYRGLMSETIDGGRSGKAPDLARGAIVAGCDAKVIQDRTVPLALGDSTLRKKMETSLQAQTFSHCFRCVTCSNACPVVRNYRTPQEVLGLLPHQIMHAVGLRLWDLVFSAKMLWDCLGCYQCQQQCPQGVCVADVLYELKSVAITRTREKIAAETGVKA
ncbi:MAG TPA: 4Fe-4S dicluster domain-containing protein [Syntrophobacteria bacterium]|nr:4Fe-4S dicluster domain-containing protein [Syntrophobacteria bacterium]